MRIIYTTRAILFFALMQFFVFSATAQKESELWKDLPEKIILNIEQRSSVPTEYRSLGLDLASLTASLSSAKNEDNSDAFVKGPVISLPMPDGSFSRFAVALSSVVPKALTEKFPMIHTYTAIGIDDTSAYAKVDVTQLGFHAMIVSPKGWFFIDPAFIGNTNLYISYDRKYTHPTNVFICEADNALIEHREITPPVYSVERSSGTQLKTYRTAVACTGEYASFFGGTPAAALSAIVTSVNRVSGVYELEMAVRLVLIANNNLIVYTNAGTDPYTNGDGGTMLGQNQTTLDNVIGSANYDIGHVFGVGSGGVAYLGVICSSSKAGGVTGNSSPVGDNFDIDYVAHEMGHQFGGNHTFNSVTGSCNGNRSSSSAYEVGSGTTIMAYAGICDADDIQPHSDAIFHAKSFDEIQTYITSSTGSTCPVVTATNNTPPVISVGSNYTIPLNTPFILTGSATDVNGDALTYLWEEYDLGPAGTPNSPSGNAPIFRDFVPTVNPYRVFPRLEDLVRNQQTLGEILPTYARSLAFKLTVRDNRAGGGGVTNNNTSVSLTVTNTTTPFKVTIPNTAVSWFANSSQTITWDVSSTNIAPVSCANVNILLSVDSGYTYPYILLANTPNDGSQDVTLPNVISNKARVKVESVGNIFFDISNVNFTISASSPVVTLINTSALISNNICAGSTVNVSYTTDGPANAGNVFKAQLSNSTGNFSSPTDIGTLSSVNAGTIVATIPAGTVNGTGYRIRVVSSNPVVTGSNNGSNITIFQAPLTPGTITGLATVCQGQTGVVYTVPAITNATGYTWNFTSGATITSGTNTNSVTVTFSASAVNGTVTVLGTNASCGNGPASSPKPVTVNVLPGSPGVVSGTGIVCQNQSGVNYSVPAIANATGYLWTLPTGASITGGNNTNSITVSFASNAVSGNVTVAGNNSCGNGTSSNFPVTVNTAPAAPVITAGGPVSICNPGSVMLSFTPVAGVTYQWRKNGANIGGQTSSNYSATTTGNYDVVATFTASIAQTFTNSSAVSIPDNICPGATRSIVVTGYNGTVNSSGITLKLNITHPYVGDLVLALSTIDSKILGLSNQTGNTSNNGDNFTNTVFSDAAAGVLPTNGAPYTGTYKPVASTFTNCLTTTITTFAAIGSGSVNPNGTWTLQAIDRAGQDVGSILNWSLNFPTGNPNICNSSSNVISVSVNSGVTPEVSIVVNPGNIICDGTSVTFTAAPVNGGTTPVYQWKNNGTNVGINDDEYISSSLNDGDEITCEMISNAACVTGNPAISNMITMMVNPLPLISSFSPTTGISGTQVTINGSGFTNATSVSFNGTTSTFNVANDNLIMTTVPVNATNGLISVLTPCGNADSPYNFFVDVGDSVTLNLKVLIEGFYAGNGQMIGILSPSVCDTLTVGLAEINSPYSILYSSKSTISITGNGSFRFSGLVQGNSYYIVVRHRNTIEVWSKVPFLFSSQVNGFDFTE